MASGRLKGQIRRFLSRRIRPHRILAGPLRGYRIVTSWHDYPAAILGRTERGLLDWFAENVRPGDTWLDVGAHYGYTAIALSRLVGPRGRVFAFEPEVATCGFLAHTRAVNHFAQLSVIPCGLGAPDRLELGQLPVVRGMIDSTVGSNGQMLESFLLAKLDWLWAGICGDQRRVDGVKIDVQGMEIPALRGMAMLLKEFGPKLVIEVHRGVDRHELIDLLENLGYLGQGKPLPTGREEVAPPYRDDQSYAFEHR